MTPVRTGIAIAICFAKNGKFYNPVCFLRARLQQSSRLPANRLRIFAAGERTNAQLRYVPRKNLKAGYHHGRLTGGTMLVRHYMLAGKGLT